MSIFKAYDIRGLSTEIDSKTAFRIGYHFSSLLQNKYNKKKIKLVIGKDMRNSSNRIFSDFTDGFLTAGGDIIDIGLCSTPMLHYATNKLSADAGAMITASHNPKEYNGIKICLKGPTILSNDLSFSILEKSIKQKIVKRKGQGRIIQKNILEKYVKFLSKFYDSNKKLKIVIDAGNGVAGIEIMEFFKRFPNVGVIPLFFNPDGNFPNHEANPTKISTLKKLQKEVVLKKADLGCAFDGDADRVGGFVDHTGRVISNDLITAMLAEDYLKNKKNKKIVVSINSSNIIKDTIIENKGIPIISKVGRISLIEKMKEEKAIFGGEFTGHYFFKEFFNFDCAMLALIKVINIISIKQNNLANIISKYDKYHSSGEINIVTNKKDEIISKLKKNYQGGLINELDGLRVDFSDWWFIIRKSNTEPVIRIIIEAESRHKLNKKKKEIISIAS